MAKRLSFPTREREPRRRRARAPISAGTFIQRSRAESSEQKAIWHNQTGAGKSHVVREFFGLTEVEAGHCRDLLSKELEQRLARLSR